MAIVTSDIVVVGAGVIGASIAQQLARDGTETVVVCEQYWGGAQTATTQSGGILRLHHTVGCDVGLAARSLPTYQRFGEVVGGDCGYVPVGFALLVGANHTDALVRNVDTVRSCGGRTELLEPEQLVRSYPGLRLGGFAAAAYEPDCGYGDPATTARALLAAAEAAGAMLLRGVRVERLLTHGERISGVRTTVGDIPAATVVLAAGAASAALARTIGLEIPVIPQPIGMAFSFPGDRTASAPVPATIDDTIGNYLRPADRAGIYFGVPCHAEPTDLRQERVLRADDIESARKALQHRVPALVSGCLAGTRLGVDGYTPDRHPLIGTAGPDGLYLATGMSGGGYKIAPAVGELAVKEIRAGTPQSALTPYRPERFSIGRPVLAEFDYQWM